MTTRPTSELLYDSEATLRLVDSALLEIGDLSAPEAAPSGATPAAGLAAVSRILERGYFELVKVLDNLRQSRSVLERSAIDKLSHTGDKLREVSSATEVAATDILDGLERATSMVDQLDAFAESESSEGPAIIRAALRDELFALVGHMQFQDIASQQLHYASAVLRDIEERVAAIARVFDPASAATAALAAVDVATSVDHDPNATTGSREARQAVADELLANRSRTG